MNMFFGFAIVFTLVFLFFIYVGMKSADDLGGDDIKGYSFILGFLALLIVGCVALGDGTHYQEQLNEQKARYERNIINGTYKIVQEETHRIIGGDTTITKGEPTVIILEN